MPGKAAKIVITERQEEILEAIVRQPTSPQRLVERAQIVLLGFRGWLNEQIAERLGVGAYRVGFWRRRWAGAWERLVGVECGEGIKALRKAIEEVLSDAPRSGSPGKFTAEQVTQILAVACESPEDCGRPVTHWTPKELADEVRKRGMVEAISARQVGRFLKSGRLKTASQPVLVECESGRPGTVSARGANGLHVLPGGASAV